MLARHSFRISEVIHHFIPIIVICLLVINSSCEKDNDNPNILQNSGFKVISETLLKDEAINTIMVDGLGFKWFGTNKGLFLFDNSQWYQHPTFNGLNVYSISIHNNDITLGTSIGGYTMVTDNKKISISEIIKGKTIGSNSDTVFVYGYDLKGKKWVGTPDGLAFFDGTAWKWNQSIRKNLGGITNVRSMAFNNNDCFFGTYGNFLFHLKYNSIPTTVDAITGASQLLGGAEDPTNNYNGELTADTVYSVFAATDSSFWFGSKVGLTRNKGETNVSNGLFEYFLRGERVHCVIETSDKIIWAGTENGLNVRVGMEWTNYNISNGLPGNFVVSLAEDKDSTIWIGTNRGISHFSNVISIKSMTTK